MFVDKNSRLVDSGLTNRKTRVYLYYQTTKKTTMTTIIFKNENLAKVYEIRAAIDHHIYKKGELIYRVKTDNIKKIKEEYNPFQITITKSPAL